MEVWRDGASSVVLWLHVWGPWWGEHPGTQVLQLHKKIVLQAPISGHWLVLLGAGEKLLCFTKTLFTSIVCLVSCALDFIWKHQIRGQAVLLPRLNAAVLHGGSIFGYWPSTGQLLLGSLRAVRLQPEETARPLKNPSELQLLTCILTSTLWKQWSSFKKSLFLNYFRCSAWFFLSMKPHTVWDLAFLENILSYVLSYATELK